MLTPILPGHARELGASRTMVVVLFALFPLAVLLSSPVFGWFSGTLGREAVLYSGLLLSGLSCFVFGYTKDLIVMCAFRFVMGLGSAATWAATYALLADIYPYRSTIVIGFTETATGLGGMVGPALAAYLAAVKGFAFPCAVVGALLLSQCIAIPLALKYKRKPQPHLHHIKHSFQHPGHNLERRFEKQLLLRSASLQSLPNLVAGKARDETGEETARASEVRFSTPQPEGKNVGLAGQEQQQRIGGLNEIRMVAPSSPIDAIKALTMDQPTPDSAAGECRPITRSRSSTSDEPYPPLTFRALMNPTVITCSLAVLMAEATTTGVTPFLATWLEDKHGFSLTAVGYLLTVSSFTYGVLAPMSGYITHYWGSVQTMLVGVVLLTLGYLLMGPIPPLESLFASALQYKSIRIAFLVAAMACEGFGVALIFVPALPTMMSSVYELGPSATGAISGSFYALFSVGQTVGPFLGEGIFFLSNSFEWVASVLGLMVLPLGPLLLLGRRDLSSDDDATFELYDEETETTSAFEEDTQLPQPLLSSLSSQQYQPQPPAFTASPQPDGLLQSKPRDSRRLSSSLAAQQRLVNAAVTDYYGSFEERSSSNLASQFPPS